MFDHFAQACGWDDAPFLLFSENVFDPLIYYSHLAPALLALGLFVLIFINNRKELLSKLLMTIIILFCVWSLMDLVLWASEKPDIIMFFWSTQIFFELLIYIFAFYFAHVFLFKKDLPFTIKFFLSLFLLPVLIDLSSGNNLIYFDLTNCEREAAEGMLWQYVYFMEIFLIGVIFLEMLASFFINKKHTNFKETVIVSSGIILFLASLSWGNIIGSITEDWATAQYGLFGLPIFIGFLMYAIVKFQSLNFRALAAQVFIGAIIILVGTQFFFVRSTLNRILTGITLLLVVTFGIMFIRSVRQEIKQKEELQKLTAQLQQSNARLFDLDKQKSEFISIASHQLRTPLTAIKGYVSLLLEGSYGTLNKDVNDVLNKVYSVNDRLVHLVEDLLNVSRIEAGRIQYNFQPTQFADILTELHDMFGVTAKNKGLEFTLSLPDPMLPMIMADPNKMKEISSNLIDNAIKYTPKGSVNVALEKVGQNARITISDTGIGIKPEDKEHLFTKFVRSKETSRMVVGGVGLGLFVGKSFVQAHKGNIWAESDGVDKGSKFIIEIPIVNPELRAGTIDKKQEA